MQGAFPPRTGRAAPRGNRVPRWEVRALIASSGADESMAILVLEVDLAKRIPAVHGVHEAGTVERFEPSVARGRLGDVITALLPCPIGKEDTSRAHRQAGLFQTRATRSPMAAAFVAPCRRPGKRGKTDAADAATIGEAALCLDD